MAEGKREAYPLGDLRPPRVGNGRFLSLSVTSAKTRWGSCSYNDALHFSFRLLYAPVEVIDYVAVHELSHTFYKNHGKAFWAAVEKYVPDYKKKRAWLKENTLLMEIF